MSTVREIVHQDKDRLVSCDYLFNRSKAVLHLEISKGSWSTGMFKESKIIFERILDDFKKEGYNEIYATVIEDNKKAKKLVSMFGFNEVDKANGLIIMQRDI